MCEVESAQVAHQHDVVLAVDEVMEEEERISRRRVRFKYRPNAMDLESWCAQGIYPS